MALEGGRGAVAPRRGMLVPPSGKNFVSVGEFSTKNCVQMHRKIPFFKVCEQIGDGARICLMERQISLTGRPYTRTEVVFLSNRTKSCV